MVDFNLTRSRAATAEIDAADIQNDESEQTRIYFVVLGRLVSNQVFASLIRKVYIKKKTVCIWDEFRSDSHTWIIYNNNGSGFGVFNIEMLF